MPRCCTVCAHPLREKIEKAVAEGRTLRRLASTHALTKSSIHRHMPHSNSASDRLFKAVPRNASERKGVRGNPDKTKPYRWKRGQSGNPGGRSSKPHDGELDALLRMFT